MPAGGRDGGEGVPHERAPGRKVDEEEEAAEQAKHLGQVRRDRVMI